MTSAGSPSSLTGIPEVFEESDMCHSRPTLLRRGLSDPVLAWSAAAYWLVAPLQADPLDQWRRLSPVEQSERLVRVAFGHGLFIAVGQAGEIQVSPDGANWTRRHSGTAVSLNDISAAGSLFVAVGEEGTILTSADTQNWERQESGTTDGLAAVISSNGRFVAVARNTVVISADGAHWTAQKVVTGGEPSGLTFGNGRFVAALTVSYDKRALATSPDGLSWKAILPPADTFPDRVIYGRGQFVAVGGFCGLGGCSGSVLSSVDGVNWSAEAVQRRLLHDVAFGRDEFVAVGGNCDLGGCSGLIVSSRDGHNWTPRILDIKETLTSVAFGNDIFVVLGEGGLILRSDSLGPLGNWHWRNPMPQSNPLTCAGFGSDLFLAGGNGGFVLTSANALTWNLERNDSVPGLLDLTYGDGLFVGVTAVGGTAFSTDGRQWTTPDQGAGSELRKLTFHAGRFVAVGGQDLPSTGSQSSLFASNNGIDWSRQEPGTTNLLSDVTWGQGQFLAVGAHGTVVTSADGLAWQAHDAGAGNTLEGVTFGDHLFVAVGEGEGATPGLILTSVDGFQWTEENIATDDLLAVAYGNGVFVAVGGSCGRGGCARSVFSSNDGHNWIQRNLDPVDGLVNPFRTVLFAQGTFVAVGADSTILTSVDGVRWHSRSAGVRPALRDITCGADALVAVGGYLSPAGSSSEVLRSTDGVNWTTHAPGPGALLNSAAFGNGSFVIAGDQGTLFTSTNGVDWLARVVPGDVSLDAVRYAAAGFVLMGHAYDTNGYLDSTIWTSTEGADWAARFTGTNQSFTGVAYGNGIYVAVGSAGVFSVNFEGRMLISTNAIVWTPRDPQAPGLFDVAFGNGLFVATAGDCDRAGCTRVILTSTDGLTWTANASRSDPLLGRLSYAQGYFTAVGSDANLFYSTDGVHWINGRLGLEQNLAGVGFAQETVWVVGDNGAILQSDPLSAQPPSIVNAPSPQDVIVGAAVSLRADALGSSPLSFQWLKNGVAINAATNSDLAFRQVGPPDQASYSIVVTNPAGAAVTQPVPLSVRAPPEGGQLSLELDPFAELTLVGAIGRTYEVQSVDSLQATNDWTKLTRIQLPAIPFTWTDPQSLSVNRRFYRALVTP